MDTKDNIHDLGAQKKPAANAAHFARFVRPGTGVLDRCYGSGLASFWFEELGARVTGMDFAPYRIALAREEALRRNSRVKFVEAGIFPHDYGRECFGLVSCFDNGSDFPLSDSVKLVIRVSQTLKPGGRFIIKYVDGCHKFMKEQVERARVHQELPERITFHHKEYLPEIGPGVNIILNETRREGYERMGYIYTTPIVHLAVNDRCVLERCAALSENELLDTPAKPELRLWRINPKKRITRNKKNENRGI